MLFQTLNFLLFFLPVFFINLLATNYFSSIVLRKAILVAASAIFYMSWNIPLFSLLVFSISLNYYVGHKIAIGRNKLGWVRLAIIGQLGILAVFKYANFGIESAAQLLQFFGIDLPMIALEIILPLGISFYTFQGMSYVIDLYRGRYAPYRSFLDFFLYISFFPQLIAGPIVRADYFLERLRAIHKPITLSMITTGLMLFVTGLFKKVVLADNAAIIANMVFDSPGEYSALITLLGLYAFAFQIYFDFSGYTDMARGIGRMLGIDLPINFNLPYLSRGLREFWKKWHISLSSWLQDYLYISLGGNRVTKIITYRNLLVTMLLGGLWHGASINFVIWGGIHGTVLAIEHAVLGKRERDIRGIFYNFIWIFITFHIVCFAWIFFRAEGISTSLMFLSQLTHIESYTYWSELNYFKPQNWLFGIILPFIVVFFIEKYFNEKKIAEKIEQPNLSALVFIFMFFLVLLVSGGSNEFVYFQF